MLTSKVSLTVAAAALCFAPACFAVSLGLQAPCVNCDEGEMRAKAAMLLPDSPGTFSIGFYNLEADLLRRFESSCDDGAGNATHPDRFDGTKLKFVKRQAVYGDVRCPEGKRTITMVPNERDAEAGFALLRRVWLDTDGIAWKKVDIQIEDIPMRDGPYSSVALLSSFQKRVYLGTALAESISSTVGELYGELANWNPAAAGFFEVFRIYATVFFSDGVSVKYSWQLGSDHFEFDDDSGRTAGGQLLSEDGEHAGGEWMNPSPTGAPDDLGVLAALVETQGARLIGAAGEALQADRIDGARIARISCNRIATRLTCVVEQR